MFFKAAKKGKPLEVANLFCKDAVLVGTVAQNIRQGPNIQAYFEYFARLPKLRFKILHNPTMVDIRDDIRQSHLLVRWNWEGGTIVARMTFVTQGGCISLLHSSQLPEKSAGLAKIDRLYAAHLRSC